MGADHGAQPAPTPAGHLDPPDADRRWLASLRRQPDARAVARQWRSHTGDRTTPDARRRTLVACSGGADSTALALCLAAAARRHLVIAHVVHDLRPAFETAADRNAVAALAARLRVPFVSEAVHVRALPGNPEANARRARYAALAGLARAHVCPFVAVAHQGDDLVETLLMRLLRGSGPRGLAVLRERRPLAPGIDLVRPMLALSRAQARALSESAGVPWREDATNADTSLWRARIRRDVLPVLETLRPGFRERSRATASLLHDAAALVDARATEILAAATVVPVARPTEAPPAHAVGAPSVHSMQWPREALADLSPLLLGATIRLAHAHLVGPRQLDRVDERAIRLISRGLSDPDRRPRTWAVAGLQVDATRTTITIRTPSAMRNQH